MTGLFLISIFVYVVLLIVKRASSIIFAISFAIMALLSMQYSLLDPPGQIVLWSVFGLFAMGSIVPLRRTLCSRWLMRAVAKSMPNMSDTEREALKAGTVDWEGELFSGAPDLHGLRKTTIVQLSEEEKAFLNGPVNTLCAMINDWDITHVRSDLPPEMWTFIKENGFLGMIIPKRYGGLEFSATAQMAILVTLYGRSVSVATTISVPNSLGPAELLLKYGTEDQKNYYLPRLAKGVDIPCFALTAPNAGSDAASIPDKGIVCRQTVDGKDVLGMKLTWNKRYITLCPVATVIGLAFRLYDPDHCLQKGVDLGICCALIPADTPGVIKGRRHFPLNVAFLNGPTQGEEVFVPLDCLIGGVEMVGQGWRMLMECLSAGRAISLPSSALGGAQAAALASGAYARVRKQFNQSIAFFEGIQEPLTRIASHVYTIDAGLTLATSAIDHQAKPSVAGAILKYHTTERARLVAMDAMDIHGGKGICLGPKNYLGRFYQTCPISITVEGANILSRSLIIFGQGAIRCHPYVFVEMESVREGNLKEFDKAIWGHFGFIASNFLKSIIYAVTDGHWTYWSLDEMRRYYQLTHRYSCALAFLADFSMLTLGGALKRKEQLSARLGDLLSYLYLLSAVLKRFHNDGEPEADKPIVHWTAQKLLYDCEVAIDGIIANFPSRIHRVILKLILHPFGRRRTQPSDKLGQSVASILTSPNEARNRLTRFVFTEPSTNCPLGQLEQTFHELCAIEDLERTMHRAQKEGKLHSLTALEQIDEALNQGILTKDEAERLKSVESARQAVIAVDDFNTSELGAQ